MRRCAGGRHAGGAVLDGHALYSRRRAGCQFRQSLRFHQPGNRAPCRRQFRNPRYAARQSGQLAADRRRRALRPLATSLRYRRRRLDQGRPRSPDADRDRQELPMIRWLLLALGGALLGGVVHLATIIILPRTATQDAYSRLAPTAPINTVVAVPAP